MDRGYLAMELFRSIIDEAATFGADANLFLGGESLLHPGFVEMVAYCAEQGVPSRLYTNGTLLDRKRSEELIRAGLVHITFSFDGVDPATYEEYRRGARFDVTLERIRSFLRVKQELGSRTPFVVIQSLEYEGRSTVRGRRSFRRRFKGLGVGRFTFVRPHAFAGAFRTAGVDKRSYSPCAFPWYSLSVGWNGVVTPCCLDVSQELPLGRLPEDTLLEIWNGEGIAMLRRRFARGEIHGLSPCGRCDVPWKPRLLGMPVKSIYNAAEFVRSHWR